MDYNILTYGAVADGTTNCAAAIQQAVDVAAQAGSLPGGITFKHRSQVPLELRVQLAAFF